MLFYSTRLIDQLTMMVLSRKLYLLKKDIYFKPPDQDVKVSSFPKIWVRLSILVIVESGFSGPIFSPHHCIDCYKMPQNKAPVEELLIVASNLVFIFYTFFLDLLVVPPTGYFRSLPTLTGQVPLPQKFHVSYGYISVIKSDLMIFCILKKINLK